MPVEYKSREDKPVASAHTIDIQDFINSRRSAAFRSPSWCSLGGRSFDTAAVGFIAPALRAQWKLAPPQLVPLFGGGLFGLIAGAFIFGPIADAGTHDADC
jgi:AAHS family 4-hydroxybenzoate transporter-like MFS transporter